ADEVDDELERVAARLQRLAAVGQDRALRLDRADDAFAVRAVTLRDVGAGLPGRGVDVVPAGGGLETLRVEVAQPARAGGWAGEGRVGLAGEQGFGRRVPRRAEVALGEFADQLVAEHAPGQGWGGGRQGGEGEQEGGGAAHGGVPKLRWASLAG